jgi:hypothetical protein
MLNPHFSTTGALRFAQFSKHVSAIRLVTNSLILMALALYVPLLFPSVRNHLIQKNYSAFFITFGLLYEMVGSHLIYTNSHLKKNDSDRYDATSSTCYLLMFFHILITTGVGLLLPEYAIWGSMIFMSGLISMLFFFSYMAPLINLALIVSLTMMCVTSYFAAVPFGAFVSLSVSVSLAAHMIFESIDRYFQRNHSTALDKDSHYYAVIAIIPTFFVMMYEMIGILARIVPAPRYIFDE